MTDGTAARRVLPVAATSLAGAQELFSYPWPGPGNSEGPVDPEAWSGGDASDDRLATSVATGLLTTASWPGPGDSEG